MTRHRVAAAALAVALTGALTACAGNGPGAAATSAAPAAQTVRVYLDDDTNIQDLWQNTLIPAFEAANPGVSVDLQFDLHGANSTQTVAKLAAAAQQKKDPGIDLVEGITPDAGTDGLLADPKTVVPNLAGIDPTVRSGFGRS